MRTSQNSWWKFRSVKFKHLLKVTGELGDPQVSLDREALRSGIQKEWKEQKPWQREKGDPSSDAPSSGGLKFEWSEGRDSIR